MTTLSAAILLFLIMDPLGNVPIFLSVLKELPPKRRYVVIARELLIALGVLFFFLLAGKHLLAVLHLRQESLSIGGGIVLFLIGVKMIFPTPEGVFGETPGGEPFIVPLAIPSIAGPSTMAALMLLAQDHPGRTVDWSIALMGAWLATGAILLSAPMLYRLLGASVLAAFERLMGMVLVALSVQMILDGILTTLKANAG
jgi:multiple antibiotic resistance protein